MKNNDKVQIIESTERDWYVHYYLSYDHLLVWLGETKRKENAINIHTQVELNVRLTVCKCPFFKGTNVPVKLTIKSL